jgi:hypothetical protein
MAKSEAERSSKKYDREKDDLERLGGRICRFHLARAPDEALKTLQAWGGIEDWREAIQTILVNLEASGPEVAMKFLAVARHEITISQKVARLLAEFVAPNVED